MQAFWTIAWVQLRGLLSATAGGARRTGQRRSAVAILAAMVGFSLYLSFTYSWALASMLRASETTDLILVMMPLFGVVGSVLVGAQGAAGFIFGGRDNDLLLSLPVSRLLLSLAKLTALFADSMVMMLGICLPAGAVYALQARTNPLYWPFLIVGTVMLSLLATALGALVGLALSAFRPQGGAAVVANLASLALLLAIVAGLMVGQQALLARLISDPSALRATLRAWAAPFYWFRNAVLDESWLHLGLVALAGLVPFTLVAAVLARNFLRITSALAARAPAVRAVELTELRARSPFRALVAKEARRFFGTSSYVLNCGISPALALVGGGYLLATRQIPPPLVQAAVAAGGTPLFLISAALIMICALGSTTAPSISLEGDRLWVLREAPLAARTILDAKVAFNLLVLLPPVAFAVLAGAVVSGAGPLEAVLAFAAPAATGVFAAELGLVSNLAWPKLDAANDTLAIKQSASVLIAFLGTMAVAGTALGVSMAAAPRLGTTGALLIVLAIVSVPILVLRLVLAGWGIRTFARLA